MLFSWSLYWLSKADMMYMSIIGVGGVMQWVASRTCNIGGPGFEPHQRPVLIP